MKKTTIMIAAAVATLAVLAGCSGGSAPASDGSSAAPEPATSAAVEAPAAESQEPEASPAESGGLLGSAEWPVNEDTEAVPVPQFSVEPTAVSESTGSAIINYEGVSESEAAAYVEEVKAAGFTYDVNESKSTEMYSYSGQNGENVTESTLVIITYTKDGKLQINIANF